MSVYKKIKFSRSVPKWEKSEVKREVGNDLAAELLKIIIKSIFTSALLRYQKLSIIKNELSIKKSSPTLFLGVGSGMTPGSYTL